MEIEMKDIAYRSARWVARAIHEGILSSREYCEMLLARIETLDQDTNLVVTLDADRALREADEADRRRAAGEMLGPLHGVGMTVKDSYMTIGMRTTSGAPELANFIPDRDAMPVARLRAAGAVIIGKTNLPIYAGDAQSYNEVFGCSNNPWNLERTPGGSSGGSAGALAAGMTPLELGSDIGGSIRGPATTCGVTGHKPSYGIVPAHGQIPGPPGTLSQADIAVAGPMARNVSDLEFALDILAGPDDWHRVAYRLELPAPRHSRTSDYRLALWVDEPSCPVDSEVQSLITNVTEELEAQGVRVDSDARPAFKFDYAVDVFERLLSAAMCGGISREAIERMAKREGDDPRTLASRHAAQRHREWLSSNERRLQLRAHWQEFFEDWDVVLMPVLPTTAIPHDHSLPIAERTIRVNGEERPYGDLLKWVGLTGVAYLPSTVVPIGRTSEGLPVGVQIVGPYLEDRTCLDFARRVEALVGGFVCPPGFD